MQRTGNHTYIGRFYHALEQKGRLSIPSSFRGNLNGQAVITAGLDGCLFVLDQERWQSLMTSTEDLPLTKRQGRDWTRYIANNAAVVDIDSQGRILIPEHLRQLANLKNSVVVVGSIDRIEIWDQTAYHTYSESLTQQVDEIAESISQQKTT
jgi:MraZ protein